MTDATDVKVAPVTGDGAGGEPERPALLDRRRCIHRRIAALCAATAVLLAGLIGAPASATESAPAAAAAAAEPAPVAWSAVPALKDALPFPVGVAVDQRETTGEAGQAVAQHFSQVTPENHMKPDAWYDQNRTFRPNPQAIAVLDHAKANGLRVYGHVLVWHSQTPTWFFQGSTGQPLSSSEADRQLLRDRMRTHIFGIAQSLSDRYGRFGSPGNPLVAWDVVNEVVDDSNGFADGLRRSEWYRILGEDYIDLAFRYADEAFNRTYADPAANRPVALFINDYNTETTYSNKRQRYHSLIQRLLARGVPVDGVGHQFHVGLSLAPSVLDTTLTAFADLGLRQAVTEFDVPTGTPVSDALLAQQGRYYRDAFDVFRRHADQLFSVTAWGLPDTRSWRAANGAPLLLDGQLRAKPAFYGAAGLALPGESFRATAPGGPVPPAPQTVPDTVWDRITPTPFGLRSEFRAVWADGALAVRVAVGDGISGPTDGVELTVGDTVQRLDRSGGSTAAGTITERAGGYVAQLRVPLTDPAAGRPLAFDVRVTDGPATTGWNGPGATGVLELGPTLPDPGASFTAEAGVRCVAGRAMPTITVTNRDDVPVTVDVTGPGSTKSFREVRPGRNAFHAFTTRQTSIVAGAVTVSVVDPAATRPVAVRSVPYPATSC